MINLEEHISCPHYLTGEQALFQLHELQKDTSVGDLNHMRNVLLYLISGEIEIALGHFSLRKCTAGSLIFLPKNIQFHALVSDNARLISCACPEDIPLCNRHAFFELLSQTRRGGVKYLSDSLK